MKAGTACLAPTNATAIKPAGRRRYAARFGADELCDGLDLRGSVDMGTGDT